MNTLFEISSNSRYLSDVELLYNITNSRQAANEYNEQLKSGNAFFLDELLASLTPGRKKVAEAVVEMYKRTRYRDTTLHKIRSSQDLYHLMNPLLRDLPNEEFWIILMNQANLVIKRIRLSFGGIDGTYADVRLLLKQAVLNNASSMAVIHNHPSGKIDPSPADKKLTQQIKKATEMLNINLIDHVIITDKAYYSFADEGTLQM